MSRIVAAITERRLQIATGNPFNFGPTWSPDGQWILSVSGEHYNCHPYIVRADGTVNQLTQSPDNTLHYHPQPSADGLSLLYGCKRNGVRQLCVMQLADRTEKQITNLTPGHAAMWPHWQPVIIGD